MSDQVTKKPLRIRTFAGDLDFVKQLRSGSATETAVKETHSKATDPKTVTAPVTTPTPTAKSATAFPNVKHIPEEKLIKKDIVEHTPITPAPKLKEVESFPSIAHTHNTHHEVTGPKLTAHPNRSHAADKPIPSFHELQKKVTEIHHEGIADQKLSAQTPNHIKETSSNRPNIGYDSTIITDTISNRFQLFPSIIQAVKKWFRAQQVNRRRKKVPTYTIPETERRKGVIQKATTKTGTIFTADSETIKERIRRRQQTKNTTQLEEPETTWSPYTDTGYYLLEAPDTDETVVQNVSVSYRKIPRVITAPKPEAPSVTVPPEQPIITVPAHIPPPITSAVAPVTETLVEEKEPTPIAWGEQSNPKPLAPTLEAVVTPVLEPVPEEDTTVISEVVEPAPEPLLESEQEPIVKLVLTEEEPDYEEDLQSTQPTRNTTNTLALLILTGIVCVVLLFLGVLAIISYVTTQNEGEQTVQIEQTILQATVSPIVITPTDVQQFLDLLTSATEHGPAGVTEIPVLAPDNTELNPAYVLSLLNFRTTPHFAQSLSRVRFVTINHNRPAVLLRFTNVDEIRGGLLLWEPSLHKDFAQLYNIETTGPVSFNDETIDNIDVRTLTIDDTTVLVYGIINNTTAVIANSKADFSQITKQGLVK